MAGAKKPIIEDNTNNKLKTCENQKKKCNNSLNIYKNNVAVVKEIRVQLVRI